MKEKNFPNNNNLESLDELTKEASQIIESLEKEKNLPRSSLKTYLTCTILLMYLLIGRKVKAVVRECWFRICFVDFLKNCLRFFVPSFLRLSVLYSNFSHLFPSCLKFLINLSVLCFRLRQDLP